MLSEDQKRREAARHVEKSEPILGPHCIRHESLSELADNLKSQRPYFERLNDVKPILSGCTPADEAIRGDLERSFLPESAPLMMGSMNAEALYKLLEVRPFEPVEVELSSGQVFTIKHPETVIVMKNTLVVADPDAETVQWTSLIHVVAVRRRQTTLPSA